MSSKRKAGSEKKKPSGKKIKKSVYETDFTGWENHSNFIKPIINDLYEVYDQFRQVFPKESREKWVTKLMDSNLVALMQVEDMPRLKKYLKINQKGVARMKQLLLQHKKN